MFIDPGLKSEKKGRRRRRIASSIDPESVSWWSQVKRLVYRTPEDVIQEIGLKDEDGIVIEKEISVVRHHWILLVGNLLVPVLVVLLCGGLLYYRAIGGGFLNPRAAPAGEIDIFNVFLIFMILTIALVWFIQPLFGTSNKRNTRQILVAFGVFLAAILFFRYQGGRVFDVGGTGIGNFEFDLLNGVLIAGMVLGVLYALYTYFDWLNDFLILTNYRVIYDDEKLFVRRQQDQIAIEDIQNVVARTGDKSPSGYLKYYLKFGTIVIQSASFRRDIVFRAANNPAEMQRRIMDEVKKKRSDRSKEDVQKIIKTKVLRLEEPSSKPKVPARRSKTVRFLGKIFPENPEHREDGTIIWRPHWIFAVAALARPFTVFIVVLVLLFVGERIGLLPVGWFGFILIVGGIGFVGWAVWAIEDYRNDQYILTPNQVIDIEQIPFGPEDRRSASLGTLQNVQLKTSFIGRLIGYGDVELETAGGKGDSKFTFHGVPNPNEVVSLINNYRAEFKREEKTRNLNDTISLLTEFYNQMQSRRDSGI